MEAAGSLFHGCSCGLLRDYLQGSSLPPLCVAAQPSLGLLELPFDCAPPAPGNLVGEPLTRRLQSDSLSQGPPLDLGRHWPLPRCQWKCNTHWGNSTHFCSFPDMRSSSHSGLLTSKVCSNGSLCVSQILDHTCGDPSEAPFTGDKEKPSQWKRLSSSLFPEPQLD